MGSSILPEQELQFLFYLIPAMIGVQLALYFFYQYNKLQDVNLKLNRILLSFGTFTLLMMLGALFINISRLFVADPLLKEIFSRIGWSSSLFSPFGFLYFITIKEFSMLMNLKIVKIVMALSLIPIIVVIVVPSVRSPIFPVSIIFTILTAYYVFSFQIRVIRRSMGTIKRKFIQFVLGEFVSLSAIGFAVPVGLGILKPEINELIFFIGVSILLIGFIILFFSAYEFPPFYEFEYRENLSKLFIINQENNACLYYCNLAELVAQLAQKNKMADAPQTDSDRIFSGGIAGIESIIAVITDTKTEKIDKIKHEDSIILLEYWTAAHPLTYALVVKKDLSSLRYLLQSIKNKFEMINKDILMELDKFKEIQDRLFDNFTPFIKNMLKQ